MAAAVPFAIKAGTMIGGSLLGKKLSGPSKEQKGAMQQTQQAATGLNQMAGPMASQGMGLTRQGAGDLGAASQYYRSILGNRQQARESLAPEMQTAMDFYRGAEGKAGRTLRGGSRDTALAELNRQKVGNMAMMLPQARARAAEGAAGVGGTLLGGGTNLAATGGNLASNAAYLNQGLFNQASQIRQQQGEGGKGWGSLLYDVAGMLPWGKGKGGGGGGGGGGNMFRQGAEWG